MTYLATGADITELGLNYLKLTVTGSSYSMVFTDDIVIGVGTITITLPPAAGIGGRMVRVKNLIGGGGLVTVVAPAGYVIDLGGITSTVLLPNECATFISDGSNWLTVSRNKQDLYIAGATASYTMLNTDEMLICYGFSGAITITLPTAVAINGRVLRVKNAGTGIITMGSYGSGAELIDGSAPSATKVYPNDSLTFVAISGGWWII